MNVQVSIQDPAFNSFEHKPRIEITGSFGRGLVSVGSGLASGPEGVRSLHSSLEGIHCVTVGWSLFSPETDSSF